MSLRAKLWAKKARQFLLNQLGGHCACCGVDDGLTFDCIQPTGDSHHRGSTDQRMSFYRQQNALGNIQVLCHKCNSRKGDDVIDYRLSQNPF